MATPPTKRPKTSYKNDLPYQVLYENAISKPKDIRFTFEKESKIVSAHKDLLAVSSPVFNAMFNGELQEKGDVKIADAPAAAFREFLQFFYVDQVVLTMENIADVLNLAHKYDVTGGVRIVAKFLKENIETDKLLLALHLALKYQLNSLKVFCKQQIGKEISAVLDGINFEEGDEMRLSMKNGSLSEAELKNLLPHILSITKENLPVILLVKQSIFEAILSERLGAYEHKEFQTVETMVFTITQTMLLSEINFAAIYRKKFLRRQTTWEAFDLKGTVRIGEQYATEILFEQRFGFMESEKNIKLNTPVLIQANRSYSITILPSTIGHPSILSNTDLMLKAGVKFRLHQGPKYTLIERLYFIEASN